MGRDKAAVRLGRRTLLGHVKAMATSTGWPVRIIRKDVVERCGPLGGILTAFRQQRADMCVFLSCDMPFITVRWLKRLVRELKTQDAQAVFTQQGRFVGFPFVLSAEVEPVVETRRQEGDFSLQTLARQLKAVRCQVPMTKSEEFVNVNTPEALEAAKVFAKRKVH